MFVIAFVPVGVVGPRLTGIVIALPLPGTAIAVVEVQLIEVPPTAAPGQDQPVPEGAAERVRPLGSVSVTVIVPDVAADPVLSTVMV